MVGSSFRSSATWAHVAPCDAPLRHAFRPSERTITQNRWACWVMCRSSGAENGTKLEWPAGPKSDANVYVASILSQACGEAAMV
jgi:hypothetical protein